MDLSGRSFIVTGASSGLGAATARRLVAAGALVTVAARRQAALETLRSELGSERVLAVPTDLTTIADIDRLASVATDRFGGLHGVVHCAGVALMSRLDGVSAEVVEHVVRVNLLGPIWLTRACLPALRAQPEAVIVLVSSMSAVVGPPLQAPYTASKAGLAAFGDTLRRELGSTGVRVVVAYPGVLDTPMIADFLVAAERVGVTLPMPKYAPERAADQIVEAMRGRRTEVIVGGWRERVLAVINRRLPRLVDAGMRRMLPDLERLAQMETQVRAEREARLTRR